MPKYSKEDLIFPDLSYEIIGASFDVFNELGPGFQEKHYQKALARELSARKINFIEQLPIKLNYKDENIGRYFLDFLVEEKIILELKKGEHFSSRNIKQILNYLKSSNLQSGILIHFGNDSVKYKRIVNQY